MCQVGYLQVLYRDARSIEYKKKFNVANIMIEIKACQKGWMKQNGIMPNSVPKKAPDMGGRNHGKTY